MNRLLILVGLGVAVYFVVKSLKEKAAKSKLEALGVALSGSTVVNPATGQTQGWTPYGPQAGNV
jgi:hypothetical protein